MFIRSIYGRMLSSDKIESYEVTFTKLALVEVKMTSGSEYVVNAEEFKKAFPDEKLERKSKLKNSQ